MDTHLIISYLGGHETSRYTPESGEASTPGNPSAEGGQAVSRRCHERGFVAEFSGSVAAIIPKGRKAGIAREAFAWPNTVVDPATEGTFGPAAPSRSNGNRLCDKPVDVAPHWRSHPSRVWRSLYHTQCLEVDARHGLELSKAEQARPGAQRASHTVLETARLASHKKKPQHLEPTWASLTKAGSCSSRRSLAHGLRRDEPPCLRRPAIGPKSPPSPLSPSHLNAGAWGCIVDFIPTRTSALRRSFSSFDTFCATYGDRLFFSGIVDCHTEPKPSLSSYRPIRDCICISYRHMPQNSTRTNLSGTT